MPAGLQMYIPSSAVDKVASLSMLVTEQQDEDRDEDTSTNICEIWNTIMTFDSL